MSNAQQLVQKLRNYWNILRDNGLSYGDYVGQLTFLLFMKMADEQWRRPCNKASPSRKGCGRGTMLQWGGGGSTNLQLATRLRQSILSRACSARS